MIINKPCTIALLGTNLILIIAGATTNCCIFITLFFILKILVIFICVYNKRIKEDRTYLQSNIEQSILEKRIINAAETIEELKKTYPASMLANPISYHKKALQYQKEGSSIYTQIYLNLIEAELKNFLKKD